MGSGLNFRSGLSRLAGKKIAVLVALPGRTQVLRGLGIYERDEAGGNLLRIRNESRLLGNPEFVFHESEWRGEVIADTEYGCDYLLTINARSESAVTT